MLSKLAGIATVIAAACVMSTAAHATDLAHGLLNIKGSLYSDSSGVETKVKCSSSDGNRLDSSGLGVRIFHIVSYCSSLWGFTGANDTLDFYGKEIYINAKQSYVFSGVQNTGNSAATGSAAGLFKCAGSYCSKDQGTIDFSWDGGGGDTWIFIGKYKASFR